MPRFRPVDPRLAGLPVTAAAVRRVAAEVIAQRHFFVAPDLELEWTHQDGEHTSWEIFRGRLLDPAHTREQATFESWGVYEITAEGRSAEPVLSVKLDEAGEKLYVVRALECYVWEGYDSGGGVILSRERRKWVRELVATLRFDQFADLDKLRDSMICGLYHAVVGTSRLPLTSVEAPLPAFSFGQLFYYFRERASPATWSEMLSEALPKSAAGKLLQTFLLTVPFEQMTIAEFADLWTAPEGQRLDVIGWLEAMFNDVSLSPWTELTRKVRAFLFALRRASVVTTEEVLDFVAGLLRRIARHLTAYDLVTFHHRGANYPDALLLYEMLEEFGGNIACHPELVADAEDDSERERKTKRLRRRALRQAWLIRCRYKGHAVPDMPTSPGENNRVLPPSHPRVPEEQILHLASRTRRLFEYHQWADNPDQGRLAILRQSVADLAHPDELRELGVGLFVDRPLSAGKAPGEPDATPLLASLAFSRSIAAQRIHVLAKDEVFMWQKPILDAALRRLLDSPPCGLPLDRIGDASRPGSVSLSDARLASPDFEFLRTVSSSRAALQALFDFGRLPGGWSADYRLLARDPAGPGLLVYDSQFRPRVQMEPTAELVCRGGVEYPAGGMLVTRTWEETSDGSLREHGFHAAPIRLPPWE
jgi:hypothetical protein